MRRWISFSIHECFITKRTDKAVRIRLPKWLDDVVGSFWIPAGCLREYGTALCMPDDMRIEISYKKADDFGQYGEWQKRAYTPEVIKTQMFEVDGHNPAEGDLYFDMKAPELAPVHTEPLEELLDI